MKIPSSRLSDRLAEILVHDFSRLHKVGTLIAGYILEDIGKLSKFARYRLRDGAASLSKIEEKSPVNLKAPPVAYLLVTLGLAGVVCLKILLDRQNKPAEPE